MAKECPHPWKRCYDSKAEATKVIKEIRRRTSGKRGHDLDAYGCVCGKVHIGKSRKKFEARIKRVTSRKPMTKRRRGKR